MARCICPLSTMAQLPEMYEKIYLIYWLIEHFSFLNAESNQAFIDDHLDHQISSCDLTGGDQSSKATTKGLQ